MDQQTLGQLYATLYSDLKPEPQLDTVRPLLAHYTSLSTVEAIIRGDQIWFSNPLLMNDFEEVHFGIVNGNATITNSTDLRKALQTEPRSSHFFQKYLEAFSAFDLGHLFDTYVFCLSEHDPDDFNGRLSMWRAYGGYGTGAALVFDSAQLVLREESPLIIAPVYYATSEERLRLLDDLISRAASFIESHDLSASDLSRTAVELFERLKVAALFTKHIGFAEEREWRVVFMPNRPGAAKLAEMAGYELTDIGIEPKLKFSLRPIDGITQPDLSLGKLLSRIILGPSRANPLAIPAFRRMLANCGKSEYITMVNASSIPFRHRL